MRRSPITRNTAVPGLRSGSAGPASVNTNGVVKILVASPSPSLPDTVNVDVSIVITTVPAATALPPDGAAVAADLKSWFQTSWVGPSVVVVGTSRSELTVQTYWALSVRLAWSVHDASSV